MTTTTPQFSILECSRNILSDESQDKTKHSWRNNFKTGFQINKGDTISIENSFINCLGAENTLIELTGEKDQNDIIDTQGGLEYAFYLTNTGQYSVRLPFVRMQFDSGDHTNDPQPEPALMKNRCVGRLLPKQRGDFQAPQDPLTYQPPIGTIPLGTGGINGSKQDNNTATVNEIKKLFFNNDPTKESVEIRVLEVGEDDSPLPDGTPDVRYNVITKYSYTSMEYNTDAQGNSLMKPGFYEFGSGTCGGLAIYIDQVPNPNFCSRYYKGTDGGRYYFPDISYTGWGWNTDSESTAQGSFVPRTQEIDLNFKAGFIDPNSIASEITNAFNESEKIKNGNEFCDVVPYRLVDQTNQPDNRIDYITNPTFMETKSYKLMPTNFESEMYPNNFDYTTYVNQMREMYYNIGYKDINRVKGYTPFLSLKYGDTQLSNGNQFYSGRNEVSRSGDNKDKEVGDYGLFIVNQTTFSEIPPSDGNEALLNIPNRYSLLLTNLYYTEENLSLLSKALRLNEKYDGSQTIADSSSEDFNNECIFEMDVGRYDDEFSVPILNPDYPPSDPEFSNRTQYQRTFIGTFLNQPGRNVIISNDGNPIPSRLNYPEKDIRVNRDTNRSYVYTYTDFDKSFNCLPEIKMFSRWRDEYEYSTSSPIQYQEFLNNHGVDFTSFHSHILEQDVPQNNLSSHCITDVTAGDIQVLGITTGFPASGEIVIGNELIAYTSILADRFTGLTVTQDHPRGTIIYPGQELELDDNIDVIVGRSIHMPTSRVRTDTEIVKVVNGTTLNNFLLESNTLFTDKGTGANFYDNSTSTKTYEYLPVLPIIAGSGATNKIDQVESSDGFVFPKGTGINTFTLSGVGSYPKMFDNNEEVFVTADQAIKTFNPNVTDLGLYNVPVQEGVTCDIIQLSPGVGNTAQVKIGEVGSLSGEVYKSNSGIGTLDTLTLTPNLNNAFYTNGEVINTFSLNGDGGEALCTVTTNTNALNYDLFTSTIEFQGSHNYQLGDVVGVSGYVHGQTSLAKGIITNITERTTRVELRDLGSGYNPAETELFLSTDNDYDVQGQIFHDDSTRNNLLYVKFPSDRIVNPQIGDKITGSGIPELDTGKVHNVLFDPVNFPSTNQGLGYVLNDVLTGTVSGSGTGFVGKVTLAGDGGTILSFSITTQGSGYINGELLTITSGSGAGAIGKIITERDFHTVTSVQHISDFQAINLTARQNLSGTTTLTFEDVDNKSDLSGLFIKSLPNGVFQNDTKILVAVKSGNEMIVRIDKATLQPLNQGTVCACSLFSPTDPDTNLKRIVGVDPPANPNTGQTVFFTKNNQGFGGFSKVNIYPNLLINAGKMVSVAVTNGGHNFEVNDTVSFSYSSDFPQSKIPWSLPPVTKVLTTGFTVGFPLRTQNSLLQNGHNYDVALNPECELQVVGVAIGRIKILTNTSDESHGAKVVVTTETNNFPDFGIISSTLGFVVGDFVEIIQTAPNPNTRNAVARVTVVSGSGQITDSQIVDSGSGYHSGSPATFTINPITGTGTPGSININPFTPSTAYGKAISAVLKSDAYGTLNGGGYNLTDSYGLKDSTTYGLRTGNTGYDLDVTALQSARGFPHSLISKNPLTPGTAYVTLGLYRLQDTAVVGDTGNRIYVSKVSGLRTPCTITISKTLESSAFKGDIVQITSTTHSVFFCNNDQSAFIEGDFDNTYSQQIALAKKYNVACIPVNANSDFFQFDLPGQRTNSFIALVMKDTFGSSTDRKNKIVDHSLVPRMLSVGERILYDPSIVRNDCICAYNLQNRGNNDMIGRDISDHPNLMYQGSTDISCEYDSDLDRFNFSNFSTLTTLSNGIQGYANQVDTTDNPQATVAKINALGQICSEAPYYFDNSDTFPKRGNELRNNAPEITQNSKDIITSQSGIAINRVFVYKNGVKTYLDDASNSEQKGNYQNSLFSKLGFQLEQFLPIIGSFDGTFINKIKVQNITYNNAYNQPKPLTFEGFYSSPEIQASSTNSNSDLMFDLGIQIGFDTEPQIESDTFRAFDIPTKFDSSHFVIYSDILKGNCDMNYYTKFENEETELSDVKAMGYIEGFNVAGNYITGGGMPFTYTATKDYILTDINTYVLNGKGRIPILGSNSSIIYKIQKSIDLVEQFVTPTQPKVASKDDTRNSKRKLRS